MSDCVDEEFRDIERRMQQVPRATNKKTKGGSPVRVDKSGTPQAAQRLGEKSVWTKEKCLRLCSDLVNFYADERNVWLTDFALSYGISRRQLDRLKNEDADVAHVMEWAKDVEESRLVNRGLVRDYDPGFTKFILSNKHGYSDKTVLSGDPSNPLGIVLGLIDGDTKKIVSDDVPGDSDVEIQNKE